MLTGLDVLLARSLSPRQGGPRWRSIGDDGRESEVRGVKDENGAVFCFVMPTVPSSGLK